MADLRCQLLALVQTTWLSSPCVIQRARLASWQTMAMATIWSSESFFGVTEFFEVLFIDFVDLVEFLLSVIAQVVRVPGPLKKFVGTKYTKKAHRKVGLNGWPG